MLTERQLEIVFAVVYEYIKTGEPVGSRTISRKFLKHHSAATIRNEMSDLKEMGYFSQPHSSAGRIPTSRAYRIYVNSILHRPSVLAPEIRAGLSSISGHLQSLDEKLSEAAEMLGRITHCFSVAAVSAVEGLKLRKADFIRLSPGIVLLLLVVENGTVHHNRILINPCVSDEHLAEMARIINHIAADKPWNEVRNGVLAALTAHFGMAMQNLHSLFSAMDKEMSTDGMMLSTGGMREIVASAFNEDEPSTERVGAIYDLLEERERIEKLIADYAPSQGLNVILGDENERPSMHNCALMMSTSSRGGHRAVVGLIGPLRMNYGHSIAMLEAVLDSLNGRSGKENVKEETEDGR